MDNDDKKLAPLSTPLSLRGAPPWIIYVMSAIAVIYLFNPTAGFIEFIPDNIPFVGNMDEGVAALLVWYGLIELIEGRKRNKPSATSNDDIDDDIDDEIDDDIIDGDYSIDE